MSQNIPTGVLMSTPVSSINWPTTAVLFYLVYILRHAFFDGLLLTHWEYYSIHH